jgi:hypothetical protein
MLGGRGLRTLGGGEVGKSEGDLGPVRVDIFFDLVVVGRRCMVMLGEVYG